jgi:hypothetical protein
LERHRVLFAKRVTCAQHLTTQKESHALLVTIQQQDRLIATLYRTRCQALVLLPDQLGAVKVTTQVYLIIPVILVQQDTLALQILWAQFSVLLLKTLDLLQFLHITVYHKSFTACQTWSAINTPLVILLLLSTHSTIGTP